MCGCLSHPLPTGDLACNPGMCPDWESHWRPFGSPASAQSTETHQPGPISFVIASNPFYLVPILETQNKCTLDFYSLPSSSINLEFMVLISIAAHFRRDSQTFPLYHWLNFLQCLFCSLRLQKQFLFCHGIFSILYLFSPVPFCSFAFLSVSFISFSILCLIILNSIKNSKQKEKNIYFGFHFPSIHPELCSFLCYTSFSIDVFCYCFLYSHSWMVKDLSRPDFIKRKGRWRYSLWIVSLSTYPG